MIQFRCEHCDVRLTVPETLAGRQARCPRCKGKIAVPQPAATEPLDVKPAAAVTSRPSQPAATTDDVATTNESHSQPAWRILLYPLSVSGVIHLLIFSLLPPLWAQATIWQFWESPGIGPLCWLVLLTLYFIHYTATCLSDSAAGGTRAVDVNSDATPLSVDALLSTAKAILPAVLLIWAPAVAYYLVRERVDWILLTWSAVAAFAFPMIVLAVNDFDSIRAASPLLVLPSIASVFLPYCLLVCCLLMLGALTGTLLYLSVAPVKIWPLRPAVFYFVLLGAHLLGRFYYRHQERLNWGA